jgi:hypothetical protein
MRTWFGVIQILALVLLTGVALGETPSFRVQSLDLDAGGDCIPLVGDFDGDGSKDLLIWTGEDFELLWGRDGAFTRVGEHLRPPRGARLFDVADMDGDGVDEIMYLAADGLYTWTVGRELGSAPDLIVSAQCDLAGEFVGPAELVMDLDANGLGDVAWVEQGQLRVRPTPLPGQVVASQPVPLVPAHKPVTPDGLPFRVFLRDLDGDGDDDLLCVTPDGLSAFAPGKGCFDASSGWRVPFAPYLDEEDAREFTDQDLDDVIFVEDMTGDSRPDLFLSSWSRGEVLMFPGDGDFFEDEPAQILEPGAIVTRIGSMNWGNPEQPHLVISRFIPPGKVGAVFRVIAGRKIHVSVEFLLFEPVEESDRFFNPSPALERKIPAFAGRKEFEGAPHYLMFAAEDGDFDGDGWKDLVGVGDSTTVEFYWSAGSDEIERRDGRRLRSVFSNPSPEPMPILEFFQWSHRLIRERVGSRAPDLEVSVPSMQGYVLNHEVIDDINGDGHADLLLPHSPVDDKQPLRLLLLLSTGSSP